MTPFERAVVTIGERGRRAIALSHGAAVGAGGNFTMSASDTERACSTQELLCLAGSATVELAMIAQLFDAAACLGEPGADETRTLRETASGVTRLITRALEVHARDTGYEPDVWTEYALAETELLITNDSDPLFDAPPPTAVGVARRIADALFAALAALPADRMGVPEHLARALGAGVALFMIADSSDDPAAGIS